MARDAAARAGVQCHVVASLIVDALENVCIYQYLHARMRTVIEGLTDLAVVGPVGADHPECRPSSTDSSRHVLDVNNDQAGIVCLRALNAHGRASMLRGDTGVVYAHVDLSIVIPDQSSIPSIVLVDVIDEAMGRVRVVEEVELVEEVAVRCVIILKHVLSPTGGAQKCEASNECERKHVEESKE